MRNTLPFSLFLLLLLGGCASTLSEQSESTDLAAMCTITANSYPYSRDRLLYQQYGELFSEDATFQIGEQNKVSGRAAIVNALKARGPLMTTRHFSQVVEMRALDEQNAVGVSYVLIFKGDDDNDSSSAVLPTQSSHPWIVAEYHDEFVLHNNRCLIKNRKIEIIFQRS